MEGRRLMTWAERWLLPDDVERVVRPTIADWQHEVAEAPEGARGRVRRRARRAALVAIVRVIVAERVALVRAAPWSLLGVVAAVVGIGIAATGALAALGFLGMGALVFALVASTPARWITPTWAWTGVGALVVTLFAGEAHAGATRWVTLGPLHVQVTMLVLPLVLLGGRAPAAIAGGLLAAAPDALGATALAIAAPHPLTLIASGVAWLLEPAMTIEATLPLAALAASALVVPAAWRHRGAPQGRLVLGLVVLGLGAHLAGHAPMPLVGPGGSAIVAVCLAFALLPARDPRQSWTGAARVG